MAGESKPSELEELISSRVADAIKADREAREREDKLKKDPETMRDLIDRISDVTVEKLLERLAGDDDGAGGKKPPESAPLGEHPFFAPLKRKAG